MSTTKIRASTVADVMTADVVSVRDADAYKDIVGLMQRSGVSAVPVLDAGGRIAGIVSEADLLLKQEVEAGAHHRLNRAQRSAEQAKAGGLVARDFMTAPVVTVASTASIREAARLMHTHGVKRLPVVDEHGVVVGIVGRADLLKTFLRPDEDIRREVVHEVIERKLWLTPEEADIRVAVQSGVVVLEGTIDRKSLLDILVDLVDGVEGVVSVDNRMTYQFDDSGLRPPRVTPWGVSPHALRWP